MRRVVVAGLGVVTPIGTGIDEFWPRLLEQTCGIAPITAFDTSAFKVKRGGEVKGFQPDVHVRQQSYRALGRTSQLAIAAARLALTDADLDLSQIDPSEIGVCLGTTTGEASVIEQFNDACLAGRAEEVDHEFTRKYPCHMLAANVAREFYLEGETFVVPAACAAGNYALAYALDSLREGRAEVMLAGGADAFSRITYTGFARLGAISPDVCRPFDRDRQGMIPAEGAGVLVLESLESAQRRGARIYAELVGCGLSCDAHHMTAAHPEGEGAVRAMRNALQDARLNPEDVGYINAHGTGTRLSDAIETKAIKRVFGTNAYDVPVSSIKSMLGHSMGAASAIEAAACSLAIATGTLPPTANWKTRDPDCDLDYVTGGARDLPLEVAMNNAYAFGGNNAVVIFRKYQG